MGRKGIEIVLPSKRFDKKGDAQKFFSEMLNRYSNKDIVSDEDSKLLLELLEYHDEKDVKIGCGVDYIYKDVSPDPSTDCFYVKRKDGTHEDFSFWSILRSIK